MLSIRLSEKKIENKRICFNVVQIFCIWLHKADFFMAVVAQVSNVGYGLLDLNLNKVL